MWRSRIDVITVAVAIGCFVIAAGLLASGTWPGQAGNVVVQSPANYEAPPTICAPGYAIVVQTIIVVAGVFLGVLLFLPQLINRSRGAVLAAAIRPPPLA